MKEYISDYIKGLNTLYKTEKAKELSYRIELYKLIEAYMGSGFVLINEPEHIDCGAPDLVIQKSGIPVAYIETKNIGDGDLDGRGKHKEQFDRYKAGLNTIVFTDYLDFHLYEDGKLQLVVQLAIIQDDKIVVNEGAVGQFESLLDRLRFAKAQTISTASKLAELMANKAKLIKEAVKLNFETNNEKAGGLYSQMEAFKQVINKDLDEEKFSDLYAQTIVYGLFAARIHDESPDTFTRDEARKLIPKTNPFLRTVFQHLAGDDIDDSIAWIVDDLVTIFAATKVDKLRKNFEKEMQKRDPMIHFYEEFLKKYNPDAKKKYGVFYTPPEVVEFIVRAVDYILKTDFNLLDGLADSSRLDFPDENGNYQHRVQILDPATGTGTFLAEVVGCIKESQQPAMWPKYVKEHLLPRIFGFECMMAPYTIAHLKLDMLINLRGTDIKQLKKDDRVNIYLTNSLIEDDIETKHLFAQEIAEEANKANKIKHSAPVMVMLGNPPYAVSSNNKGKEFKWIEGLLNDYKKNLNERNIQPLSDDYIKFIRLAQYYVERTGEGIVAYISNNSFLDGRIHRQMRRELMRCFDDIYILDLHGNNRKQETAPDGSKDENVFDIMQGVSINIFIKKKNSSDKPAIVHHFDLFGSRKEKYAFLSENSLESINWHIVQTLEPNVLFVPVDLSARDEYDRGFKVEELMKIHVTGVKTQKDNASIFINEIEKERLKKDFLTLSVEEIKQKYSFEDGRDWSVYLAKKDLMSNPIIADRMLYRPFDVRYMLYTGKIKGIQGYPRYEIMRQLTCSDDNIGMLLTKQNRQISTGYFLAINIIPDVHVLDSAADAMQFFPLYLYPSESELGFDTERKANLDNTIWWKIENWVRYGQEYKPLTANEQAGELGFDAAPEEPHFLSPEDIFDYIYGVLHSPRYREKYKEFLKVDFPRIPYPKNADEFEHYKDCGHRLRELHLMRNVPTSKVTFEGKGDFDVKKVRWENECVYINDTQYFANVPIEAWNFYIGGYQPAQKWLKDRKDRTLSTDEMKHYEKIIRVLLETKSIMDSMDDPSAQVEDLKNKVKSLEMQLREKEKQTVVNNIHIYESGSVHDDNSTNISLNPSN